MRLSDPILFSVAAFPLTAPAYVFLNGWRRITAIAIVALLPTLLTVAVMVDNLPSTGMPMDFRKNPGRAMVLVMVPVYNLFWLCPAGIGILIGWLIRRRIR